MTVVIPGYQAARYIGEAIASVRAQSRPPAEIVVVDDGSRDGTGDVARAAGATVIRQDNRGMAAARNVAVAAARQPWIALLDADDLWLPEKLAAQWAAVERRPEAGMVFTDGRSYQPPKTFARTILQWPEFAEHYEKVARTAIAPGTVVCDLGSLRAHYPAGHFFLSGSTMLVRADLLREAGGFDETLKHWADYELTLRLLMRTTAAVVERPLFLYRLHDGNMSQDGLGMKLDEIAIARMLFARAERYPGEALAYWRSAHPANLRAAIRLLLRRGDGPRARALLRELRGYGWTPEWELARAASRALDLGGTRVIAGAKRLRDALRRRLAAGAG